MRTNKFSKKCFFDALLKLYHVKPYAEIQITDICKEAGYNRSTFYRIYPSKEALLLDGFREEYVMKYYGTIPSLTSGYGDEYIHNVELLFAFIRKNPDFFLMMREAHLLNEMFLLFREFYPHNDKEDEKAFYSRNFLSAGYLSVIYQWLDDDMRQSDCHMANMIADIIENTSIYEKNPDI